jgi:hypothetical protein
MWSKNRGGIINFIYKFYMNNKLICGVKIGEE